MMATGKCVPEMEAIIEIIVAATREQRSILTTRAVSAKFLPVTPEHLRPLRLSRRKMGKRSN